MGYETKITPQYPPAGTATTKVTIATMVGNPGPPGPTGTVDNATDIPIEDAGRFYAGNDVEAALEEAGQARNDTELRHRLGI